MKNTYDELRRSKELLQLKLDSILEPDTAIDDQELGNILDTPALQSLLADFTHLTGMGTAILDLKGSVLVATGWQEICTKFHRLHPATRQNCRESDLYLVQSVRAGEHVSYKCKNGMWDVVTPLFIGGKHMGNIFTGQFFFADETLELKNFEVQAIHHGFDRELYLAALLKVPRFSREQINTLMDFLAKLAERISKLSYSNLKLAKTMLANQEIAMALEQARAELEERVAARTNELQKVNEQLQRELGERQRAETELSQYREHLEELVKTRTEEIEKKKAEVERLNKLFVGRELLSTTGGYGSWAKKRQSR